ncbi:unnamed protein product [Adineta ricciae]|uniref:Uncharacterized protein n=1 Tax=Adineta ricciae TaxID=249248 RepID=A0A813V8J8_ADIRI|nr:unnamed protein product [Adineta ricciae]
MSQGLSCWREKHLLLENSGNLAWKIIEQITDWSKTLIHQIQEHVNDQRKLLERVYEQKVSYFDSIRDQFLQRALVFEQQHDTAQMQQLINQCNALKSDIAFLVYNERPITSIQLVTEEQLLQTCIEQKTADKESQTENPNTNLGLVNAEQDTRSSRIDHHDFDSNTSVQEVLIERCPLCYMIFPKSMNIGDRNVHINEHYQDD